MSDDAKNAQTAGERGVQQRARTTPGAATAKPRRRVLVVDDDSSMRAALRRVFTGGGYQAELYESGNDLLTTADLNEPGCILLDLQMPEMDGLSVQRSLRDRQVSLPLLFLTGSAAIRHAVDAMRAGAVDFIEKPFDNHDLLRRVDRALDDYLVRRETQRDEAAILERLQRLTPRETEVLGKIAAGLTNKEVARELGTSYRTVEIQRAHIMERMQAASLADLVRMYLVAGGDR